MLLFCGTCVEEVHGVADPGSLQYLLSLNLPFDHQDRADGQEGIRARLNSIRNQLVQVVRKEHMENSSFKSFYLRESLVFLQAHRLIPFSHV